MFDRENIIQYFIDNPLRRVEYLVDGLMDETTPYLLRRRLRRWFVGRVGIGDRWCATERYFVSAVPDGKPLDRHARVEWKKLCRRLGFPRERCQALQTVRWAAAAVIIIVVA